jgi:hypothetical protein
MKHVAALFAGIGLTVLIAFGLQTTSRGRELRRRIQQWPMVDLNGCSTEQLLALGLDRLLAERIMENRPYRSKLELVERFVIPREFYARIRNRVRVSRPRDAVKAAS